MTDFKALIGKVASDKSLTRGEAEAAFNVMMSGEATPSQMGGFLMALRVRGETVDEIAGAVATMRSKMLRVEAPPEAIDVVGTGGDAVGTYRLIHSHYSTKFYSQNEFDLTRFLQIDGVKLEMGRACTHAQFRNGRTMRRKSSTSARAP